MPLNANILIALIFLAFAITATTSTRILDEIETPEEPNTAAESPRKSTALTNNITRSHFSCTTFWAFAKPNGANLPLNNGVPQNNNNLPFLTGLGGTTANVFNNNNNNNNLLNGGTGFPKVMFGTMTVFDDELTEGHELGSGLVGKAQGFYIASAVDGTSQLMAFSAVDGETWDWE
ncbi:hypothetical protein JHK85_000199 [Glycine max]|nr:hypothetical protein JHK85_000199 [Glycine max]